MTGIRNAKRYSQSLNDLTKDMKRLMGNLSADVGGVITANADSEGNMLTERRGLILSRSAGIVAGYFYGDDGRNAYEPKNWQAQSQFAELLNRYYVRVVAEQVSIQNQWIQKNAPRDVYDWMRSINRRVLESNPFDQRQGETEEVYLDRMKADLRVFRANPLAEYEPMHTWVDPRGYQLSDRIWLSGDATRRKLDALIADGINEGMSAVRLAKRVEQFLIPGREKIRTNKPYGEDGSYDAMRLARTEIARAANQAAFISSYQNPYVDKIEVVRSRTGDARCPICNLHATIGIGGERLRTAYSVQSANVPVYHPHCKCRVEPVVTDSPDAVTGRLRGIMRTARRDLLEPVMTPAKADDFTKMILNRYLFNLVAQWRGQIPLAF